MKQTGGAASWSDEGGVVIRYDCAYFNKFLPGSIKRGGIGVVEAKIQTVEDIYRLVWTAVTTRHSLSALYGGRRRLLCPHRLGRNSAGQLRMLCYQYGGHSGRWVACTIITNAAQREYSRGRSRGSRAFRTPDSPGVNINGYRPPQMRITSVLTGVEYRGDFRFQRTEYGRYTAHGSRFQLIVWTDTLAHHCIA